VKQFFLHYNGCENRYELFTGVDIEGQRNYVTVGCSQEVRKWENAADAVEYATNHNGSVVWSAA
jgi:hypothetical protein